MVSEAAQRIFYFGVWDSQHLGHFLYSPGGSTRRTNEQALPFSFHILDSHLLPPGSDSGTNQGHVYRSLINGWTVLTFWDRSGDSRPASNSAFVVEGVHETVAGLQLARNAFPSIVRRFPFNLLPAQIG